MIEEFFEAIEELSKAHQHTIGVRCSGHLCRRGDVALVGMAR